MVLSLIKNRGMELEPFRSFDGGIALTCIIQNLVTSVRHLTYYVISCLYSFTGKYLLDWTSSSVLPTLARKSRGPGVWHFLASFCSLFDLRPVTRQHQRRESLLVTVPSLKLVSNLGTKRGKAIGVACPPAPRLVQATKFGFLGKGPHTEMFAVSPRSS